MRAVTIDGAVNYFRQKRLICCALVLALVALRALTPVGYMPAPAGSGLLFVLCPEGLPAVLTAALSGKGTHHHHGSGEGPASATTADHCPIGHLLSPAMALDDTQELQLPQPQADFSVEVSRPLLGVTRTDYRARAPPA